MKAMSQALQMPVDSMVSPSVATIEQGLGDLSRGDGVVPHINKKKKEAEVLRSPVQASIAKVNCAILSNFFLRTIAGETKFDKDLQRSGRPVAILAPSVEHPSQLLRLSPHLALPLPATSGSSLASDSWLSLPQVTLLFMCCSVSGWHTSEPMLGLILYVLVGI